MRLEDRQEQLSLAALHATCARAGFSFHAVDRIEDNWGWDARAHVYERLAPDSVLTDFSMRFQLKAVRRDLTFQPEKGFSYPVERPQYDRLRLAAGSDTPTYLVLFDMPKDEGDWVEATPERLTLRKCLRWVSLRNAPSTANMTSRTVYVPTNNVLDAEQLRELARTHSVRQWIDYPGDGE